MPIIEWPKQNENSEISRHCGAIICPRDGLGEIARLYC